MKSCKKFNLTVDTTLGKMLDNHIMTSEPSCPAIAVICLGSHMEVIHSDVVLSSQ